MWVQKQAFKAPRQPEPSINVDYFRDGMEIFDANDELNCVLPTGDADARDNGTSLPRHQRYTGTSRLSWGRLAFL